MSDDAQMGHFERRDPTCMCTAVERAVGRCSVPCPPEWINGQSGQRPAPYCIDDTAVEAAARAMEAVDRG